MEPLLDDRRVLVVGASSGIGREVALKAVETPGGPGAVLREVTATASPGA